MGQARVGGVSTLGLKSYEQRREAFQGTSIEVIWLDEEPDQDIVMECLLRTMDTETVASNRAGMFRGRLRVDGGGSRTDSVQVGPTSNENRPA